MSVSVIASVPGIRYWMRLVLADARPRQVGLAEEGDGAAADAPEVRGLAATEGDTDAAPEPDPVRVGVRVDGAVAEPDPVLGCGTGGQPTSGNTCRSCLTGPPGSFCCAYSAGMDWSTVMAWSSWSPGTETLARLGEDCDVPDAVPGAATQSKLTDLVVPVPS